MIRFSGEERFPILRSRVAARLSDAAFLAACVPDAEVLAAGPDAATWRAPSPFRAVATRVETALSIVRRADGAIAFALANRVPGATLDVACDIQLLDDESGCRIVWSAEIVKRTGLLKIVPASVLAKQCEKAIVDLWRAVRDKLVDGQESGANSI